MNKERNRVVAIHQPNFFPWLGFFAKAIRSDKFVLLDHVQYSNKNAGTWTNRVKLMNAGQAKWLTAPIDRRFSGVKPINEIQFSSDKPFQKKLINQLHVNYRNHQFYDEIMADIAICLSYETDLLAAFNIHTIMFFCTKLGIEPEKIVLSSEISLPIEARSNELLVQIVRELGGDTYLSGDGADGYQDENYYQQQNLLLQKLKFKHPIYPQLDSPVFIQGLSSIDALMNVGWRGLKCLITEPALDESTLGKIEVSN